MICRTSNPVNPHADYPAMVHHRIMRIENSSSVVLERRNNNDPEWICVGQYESVAIAQSEAALYLGSPIAPWKWIY